MLRLLKVALFYFQMSNFFRPIHWICRGFQKRHKNVSTVKLKGLLRVLPRIFHKLYLFSLSISLRCLRYNSPTVSVLSFYKSGMKLSCLENGLEHRFLLYSKQLSTKAVIISYTFQSCFINPTHFQVEKALIGFNRLLPLSIYTGLNTSSLLLISSFLKDGASIYILIFIEERSNVSLLSAYRTFYH